MSRIISISADGEDMGEYLADEISPLSEIHENEYGGQSSRIDRDYTLLPWGAIDEVCKLMTKVVDNPYPRDNWKQVELENQMSHAVNHLIAAINIYNNHPEELNGIIQELTHASCRTMFALEQFKMLEEEL